MLPLGRVLSAISEGRGPCCLRSTLSTCWSNSVDGSPAGRRTVPGAVSCTESGSPRRWPACRLLLELTARCTHADNAHCSADVFHNSPQAVTHQRVVPCISAHGTLCAAYPIRARLTCWLARWPIRLGCRRADDEKPTFHTGGRVFLCGLGGCGVCRVELGRVRTRSTAG